VIIALFAALLSAASPHRPSRPVQVQSQGQSGGVTAGWVGNINQYVVASDLAPSLLSELSKSATHDGKYSLTLTFHNPSAVPIDLVYVRYSVGSEIIGSEPSFGRKRIAAGAKLDLRIADAVSLSHPSLLVDTSFVAHDKKRTSRSFEEKFDVPDDPNLVSQINPAERVEGPIEQFGKPVLFGSDEELLRPKGEYVFTLLDDFGTKESGGFGTPNKYLMFDVVCQIVMFATSYDGKLICLAAPIVPRHKGLRRIRVYWDDQLKRGGLNVDGLEVDDTNSVAVHLGERPCDNTPELSPRTVRRARSLLPVFQDARRPASTCSRGSNGPAFPPGGPQSVSDWGCS
jgi:hypothetical protein